MAADAADLRLLERIRAGEPGAFEEFVERWQDRIYAFGLRMCGEREDALDVLQETLLKAYQSLKDLKHPEAFRTWVFRVAANMCLMKRRKGKYEPDRELSLDELAPRGSGDLGPQLPDPSALPDDDAARREMQAAVRRAVLELPPLYRAVLVLRDLEQLSTKEVARALDLSEPTVKMRLHRARLMLRKILQGTLMPGVSDEPSSPRSG